MFQGSIQKMQVFGWIQKDYFWSLHPQVEMELLCSFYHSGNEEKLAIAGSLNSSTMDILG